MIDWIQTNWLIIVMFAILVFGGFYTPGLRNIWIAALKALLTENVMKRLFLSIAEKLVASTKNKLDDAWLEELKKTLEIENK